MHKGSRADWIAPENAFFLSRTHSRWVPVSTGVPRHPLHPLPGLGIWTRKQNQGSYWLAERGLGIRKARFLKKEKSERGDRRMGSSIYPLS